MRINWKDLAPSEKNALISKYVFQCNPLLPTNYVADIAAAWTIVDKLTISGFKNEDGYELYCKISYAWQNRTKEGMEVYVAFDWKATDYRHPLYYGVAETVSEAICIAALRVLGHEVEQ